MSDKRIRKVVIVGGGTAGWMVAAAMGKVLKNQYCEIRLIESEAIGTVGVGEATIPQIQLFNRMLELDENDFIKQTQGTFKLGIEFVNWGKIGDSYIHAFGDLGTPMESLQFYHFWLKVQGEEGVPGLEAYCLNSLAAYRGKFMRSVNAGNSPLSNIAYAFQFDAARYALFLRDYAQRHGVIRTEGKIVQTVLRPDDGFIDAVVLESGERIDGELFIDCSGFRGLLIEQALKTGYIDWKHWLPCDRAIAIPCAKVADPVPYTRSTAHRAGWQWRIPLQHRTGNGHVYSSDFMSEDEATAILLANLDGEPLADPKPIRFNTGKRKKFWNKNCVAIGLASGFMEPLESTSIHLVQTAIARLMSLFPNRDFDQEDIDEYNRESHSEFDRIRDFLIAHYCINQREEPFWRECQNMKIPEPLQQKIAQFKENGRVSDRKNDLFNELSWLEVMYGQGLRPKGYHPLVDVLPKEEIIHRVKAVADVIKRSVDIMPTHAEFIARHCPAEEVTFSPGAKASMK